MIACAIDIGGTFTKLGIVDAQGSLLHFRRIPTKPPLSSYRHDLLDSVAALLAQASEVSGIGISVAGFINTAHSEMVYNPNLPWLENVPLQREFIDRFELPVSLEVDSNAAALGEYRFGAGVRTDRFFCLSIGTGIGGGFLVGGKVVRFTQECLGDVGHIIVEPGGRLCSCGGRGCAEAVAAAPAILESAGGRATNLEDLAIEAESGPLFSRAGKFLGILAASVAHIFFPDRIALGGGVCECSALVITAAQAEFARVAGSSARSTTQIVAGQFGSRAPLIGAASLVFDARVLGAPRPDASQRPLR